ncbi:hypothetical protein [Actinosynnema sp. NPDC020468]|uniref:hypothetical protein n=1 Tax=Actinosynnema sp. NPDC020468 TaxID=3154488 RepID=UPI0033F2B58B
MHQVRAGYAASAQVTTPDWPSHDARWCRIFSTCGWSGEKQSPAARRRSRKLVIAAATRPFSPSDRATWNSTSCGPPSHSALPAHRASAADRSTHARSGLVVSVSGQVAHNVSAAVRADVCRAVADGALHQRVHGDRADLARGVQRHEAELVQAAQPVLRPRSRRPGGRSAGSGGRARDGS